MALFDWMGDLPGFRDVKSLAEEGNRISNEVAAQGGNVILTPQAVAARETGVPSILTRTPEQTAAWNVEADALKTFLNNPPKQYVSPIAPIVAPTPILPDYNKLINTNIGSLTGPSAQQLALAGSAEYDKRIKQSNAQLKADNDALLKQYGSKIKSGLTKAEKKELNNQIAAISTKYKNSMEDAQKAFNFSNRTIAEIGAQTQAFNTALVPTAQQIGQQAIGDVNRIAAESGLAGTGGGVVNAGMSDASRAAGIDARNVVASILGTEAAGVDVSPAMAALLGTAPAMQFAGQTINPRQFGALQSGRLGTDIASSALAAGQASNLAGFARASADAEANARTTAQLAAMQRYERQLEDFNRMALQSSTDVNSQINQNTLAAADRASRALTESNKTEQQAARDQLALQEAGILLQQKYAPSETTAPEQTVGDAYLAGLSNPNATRLTSLVDNRFGSTGFIDVGGGKEPDPVPISLPKGFIVATIGAASALPTKDRMSYVTTSLIEYQKDSKSYNALSIALTGKPNASIENIAKRIIGS